MALRRINVPDLVGFGWNEAAEMARRAGLVPRAVGPDGQRVNGSGGVVIAQAPDPGARAARGTEIALRVAFGGGPAGDHEPLEPPPNPQEYFDWPDTPADLEKLIDRDRELVGSSQ